MCGITSKTENATIFTLNSIEQETDPFLLTSPNPALSLLTTIELPAKR